MSDFTETQRAAEGTACRSVCAWSPRGGISELLCMSGSTVLPVMHASSQDARMCMDWTHVCQHL